MGSFALLSLALVLDVGGLVLFLNDDARGGALIIGSFIIFGIERLIKRMDQRLADAR